MRSQWAHDLCLSIFGDVYATGALVFPPGARVLEIGCAEADWITPMMAERPDVQITGIDWRRCDRPAHRLIHGDVLTQDFPPESFDVVVGISSIEHIGLGHYDSDPIDPEGDIACMTQVGTWLAPGGWVYADVPADVRYGVHGDSHRSYDEAAIRERLVPPGCDLKRLWYTTGKPRGSLTNLFHLPGKGAMTYVAMLATKPARKAS